MLNNLYRYSNYLTGKLIFECFANDILEADKKYSQATGQRADKQNFVGCSIAVVIDSDFTLYLHNPDVVQ